MKRVLFGALAAATMVLMSAGSASASATLLDTDCDLLTGCLFSGNDSDPTAVEASYNLLHTEPPQPDVLTLPQFLFKLEQGINFGDGLSSFDWTSLDPVEFLVIKAGDNFMLYQLASAATSGTVTNAGLDQKAISHISFYGDDGNIPGGGVPEPATWAMMIMGFGGVGALMRRRRSLLTVA